MKPITIKHERREYEIEYLLSIVSTPCPQLNRNKWKLDLETYTFIFNTKKEPWRLLEVPCFEIELSFENWLGNFDEKISKMVNEKNQPLGKDVAMVEYKRKVARNMFLNLMKAYWKNYLDNCWCDVNEVFARTIKFYND